MRVNVTPVPFVPVSSRNPFAQGFAIAVEEFQELSMDELIALKEGAIPRKTEWPTEPPNRHVPPHVVHAFLGGYFRQLTKAWRDLPMIDRERIRRLVFTREMMNEEGEIDFSHLVWPLHRKFFPLWAAGAIIYLFFESDQKNISDRFDARHLNFLKTALVGYDTAIRTLGDFFVNEERIHREHLLAFGLSTSRLYEAYQGLFPMTVEELRMKIKGRVEWGVAVPIGIRDITQIFRGPTPLAGEIDLEEKLVIGLAEILRANFNKAAKEIASFDQLASQTGLQRAEWILTAMEGRSLVWKSQCLFEERFFGERVLPWWHFPGKESLQRRLARSYGILRALAEAKEKSPLFNHWLVQRIFFHETVNETVPWNVFCRDLGGYLTQICRELDRGLKGSMGRTGLQSFFSAANTLVGLGYALANIDVSLWEIFRKEVLRLNQAEPDDLIKILERRLQEKFGFGI